MVAVNFRTSALVFALGVFTLATIASEVRAQDAGVEPEATRILKRMTDYVGGLERFSLDAENMFDDVLESGQKIQYDFMARISIQRPNKLRAERVGDILNQLLVYDGETLTIFNREDSYYAVADAPANIDDLLVFARDQLDIVPPSSDIVFTNAFDLLTANITSGVVVGKSMIGGVKCDHLAFRSPAVDWQIWIADGEEPLPRKYVLTTMDDPAHPQYIILMSNWNVAPEADDASFRFSAPEGAKKIDFIRRNTGHTSGR